MLNFREIYRQKKTRDVELRFFLGFFYQFFPLVWKKTWYGSKRAQNLQIDQSVHDRTMFVFPAASQQDSVFSVFVRMISINTANE